ncbi:glycerophosphodiester phosphodiesterase family protein [Pseudoalteromonas obscura]|uniref:Glycerophosphodiester phosphodiesterase family protein n=1 Tax=Pseudoalteromonas obscura TaxID=3048491 RepID=A0ABT7EKE0_9GAMM|nr:glycerophosphodiester phosphodiesterase family protein [Pseudoalteromonas sp. P94(2023)]MDK2595516.1 glycerophosphodiester phosphodiesterase family protein [Pseudoalteromonas sp. P94(2023)]
MKHWAVRISILIVIILVARQPDLELDHQGKTISYKGLVQPTDYSGVTNETCTARRLSSVEHPYIENTIPAIDKAFELGADTVHLNIHATTDKQLAVFHDWTLDCRTNGEGVTSKQTMAHLKTLDAGYGYRVGEEETYPLRGKGLGLIPSLAEVLEQFPEKSFLLNLKTAGPDAVEVLTNHLEKLSEAQRNRLSFIGLQSVSEGIIEKFPNQKTYSKEVGKRCLVKYIFIGWSRYYPKSCANTTLVLPEQFGRILWGWPDQFAARAQQNGSEVYLYQTKQPYAKESDYREQGIGLFTADMYGLAEAAKSQ